MGRHGGHGLHYELAQEAARVICEERVTDYRAAKHKAAMRLGLGAHASLPDNATVQQAVVEYQQLFGGAEYRELLGRARRAAVSAMKMLAPFQPRLVGGVVSGAITDAHRVQLHAFHEKPEALDIFLQNLGIPYEQGDRAYRYTDGREHRIPLASFEAEGVGIDVAVFPEEDLRRAPLNPVDGTPFRRLDLGAAEELAQ